MILVVGGAGYIGSHAVLSLLDKNFEVVVLDNLSTGHPYAIDNRAKFIKGDIRDEVLLHDIFSRYEIDCVMHFAANCYVGESMIDPIKYYDNNVSGTISLLDMMLKHNIKRMVFSSTCAVYGIPNEDVISEETETNPINPYGRSKLMVEKVIRDLGSVYGLEYVILRYFNVAGSDPKGRIGENHEPETHLIPNILLHLLGKKSEIHINGKDYHTPDGTCIRDFIHVTDLVEAHILALDYLLSQKIKNEVYNIGNERGYSILEVIRKCEEVTGKKAKISCQKRRLGDPDQLISSSKKLSKELQWKPIYSLDDMINTAWQWLAKNS